jgi:hypothetical protein
MKGMFELMIASRLAEEILDGWRRVVRRWCIDLYHTLLVIQREARAELQLRATTGVDRHERCRRCDGT